MRSPIFSKMVPAFTALVLLGCGSASDGPETATVRGTVLLDGEPLESGSINFFPADNQGSVSGASIKDGKYSAAVPLGPKRVEVIAPQVVGQRPAYEGMENSPMIDITEERIPARYNTQSELTYTVLSGPQTKDFELESN